VEIPKRLVEICANNTSTGIRLNQTSIDKIRKSGDGGDGGDSFNTKRGYNEYVYSNRILSNYKPISLIC
jgi:hypothetical protein